MPLPPEYGEAVRGCVTEFPLPRCGSAAYGTAGFRAAAALLPPVAARVVLVAVLRAWWAAGVRGGGRGCSVGCMATASHNPAGDNGLKLIDTNGGMLAVAWEETCTAAANAATGDELISALEECVARFNITVASVDELVARCPYGVVHFARDTRPSGVAILSAAQATLRALHVPFGDHGVITTPQLHYLVQRANKPSEVVEASTQLSFGPSLYRHDILSSLAALLRAVTEEVEPTRIKRQKIVIDASNGVGALAMRSLLEDAKMMTPRNPLEDYFDITVVNDNVEDTASLNHLCGADFTQKMRSPSEEMKKWAMNWESQQRRRAAAAQEEEEEEVHYYSLDGDADRVVAFFHDHDHDSGGVWHLLDGDRVAVLYAMMLQKCLGRSAVEALDVGVVQTAYANGASTAYLRQRLGLRVYSTATGVKNLHPVAHERDVGVYFEANGHGTVLFNPQSIAQKLSLSLDSQAGAMLRHLPLLLSQVCGDGIADVFACEVALLALRMSMGAWHRIYTDLPSLHSKVVVPNPRVITNTPDERRALTPPGLQEAIDAAVSATVLATGCGARAFVRPSGTEPLVRVYAEAGDVTACKRLCEEVESFVREYCKASSRDSAPQTE